MVEQLGPITPDEFRRRMQGIAGEVDGSDPDALQTLAVEAMCEALEELGYSEGVEVYRGISRWYD